MSLLNKDEKKVVSSEELVVTDRRFRFKLIPVFTEKSHVANGLGKYFFKVSRCLDKDMIRSIIENTYSVDVVSVNTSIVSNKKRTIKYRKGDQKSFKKAMVTLKKGQVISDLERA